MIVSEILSLQTTVELYSTHVRIQTYRGLLNIVNKNTLIIVPISTVGFRKLSLVSLVYGSTRLLQNGEN